MSSQQSLQGLSGKDTKNTEELGSEVLAAVLLLKVDTVSALAVDVGCEGGGKVRDCGRGQGQRPPVQMGAGPAHRGKQDLKAGVGARRAYCGCSQEGVTPVWWAMS